MVLEGTAKRLGSGGRLCAGDGPFFSIIMSLADDNGKEPQTRFNEPES